MRSTILAVKHPTRETFWVPGSNNNNKVINNLHAIMVKYFNQHEIS